jgi:hypothetical protein
LATLVGCGANLKKRLNDYYGRLTAMQTAPFPTPAVDAFHIDPMVLLRDAGIICGMQARQMRFPWATFFNYLAYLHRPEIYTPERISSRRQDY